MTTISGLIAPYVPKGYFIVPILPDQMKSTGISLVKQTDDINKEINDINMMYMKVKMIQDTKEKSDLLAEIQKSYDNYLRQMNSVKSDNEKILSSMSGISQTATATSVDQSMAI